MSTIPLLVESGALVNFGKQLVASGVLDPSEQAFRELYATPKFVQWYQNNLPDIPTPPLDPNDSGWRKKYHGMQSAKEQVITLFGSYLSGGFMDESDLKPLNRKPPAPRLPSPVVEWRTAHVRMFGCFTAKDRAILVTLGVEKSWL